MEAEPMAFPVLNAVLTHAPACVFASGDAAVSASM